MKKIISCRDYQPDSQFEIDQTFVDEMQLYDQAEIKVQARGLMGFASISKAKSHEKRKFSELSSDEDKPEKPSNKRTTTMRRLATKKKIGVTAEEHNNKKKNRITGSARKTSVLGTKANKIGFVAKLKKVANSITDEKDSLDDFQVNITERPKPQKPSALSSLKSTWGCGTNAPNQPSAAIGRPPNSPSKTPKMWPSDEGRDSLTDYDDEEIGKVGI